MCLDDLDRDFGIFFREPGADKDSYGMTVFQRFHSIMISKDLGKSSLIRIADFSGYLEYGHFCTG